MLDDAASDNQLRYHRYQLTLSLVTGCVITSNRWRPRLSARSLAAALHEPAEGGADRAELVEHLGELGPLAPSEGGRHGDSLKPCMHLEPTNHDDVDGVDDDDDDDNQWRCH